MGHRIYDLHMYIHHFDTADLIFYKYMSLVLDVKLVERLEPFYQEFGLWTV